MILFLFVGICALCDGIKKEIPLVVVWIGLLTGIILRTVGIMEKENGLALVFSLIPGILFWMISFVTREKVGYGDGWVLLMIGVFAGFLRCFLTLLIGLVLESVILLVLLMLHKIQKDGEVPFVPFLLLGLGVVWCF